MASADTIDAILSDLKLPSRTFPLSFTGPSYDGVRGFRVGLTTSKCHRLPNVTAIILNWSRLNNVIRIASLLCGPWLDDTIAEVYVWNNSPQKLSKEIFSSAHCDTRKLRIENSPENLYFYARFFACTKVSTPYCFIQDDDYIILPELVKTLRVRMEESSQCAIYLLPPHEHLSSRLRTIVTSSGIHTGFAWLGHGTMIKRQQAIEFVSLLHDDTIGMTKDQIKMADNYFTVLRNEVPEIWFDQGIELGGGQPFTVGQEGDERNRIHIGKACRYLDEIVSTRNRIDCTRFVKRDDDYQVDPHSRHVNCAVALGASYLLESNIKLLSDDDCISICLAATNMLGNEERRARLMREDAIQHYQAHPLCCAVDGNVGSAFRSPYDAKRGDYILVDVLNTLEFNESVVELVFLVAPDNEQILRGSKFECSSDKEHWFLSPCQLLARPTTVVAESAQNGNHSLECSVRIIGNHARFFRATAKKDASVQWMIYGVWFLHANLKTTRGQPQQGVLVDQLEGEHDRLSSRKLQ